MTAFDTRRCIQSSRVSGWSARCREGQQSGVEAASGVGGSQVHTKRRPFFYGEEKQSESNGMFFYVQYPKARRIWILTVTLASEHTFSLYKGCNS